MTEHHFRRIKALLLTAVVAAGMLWLGNQTSAVAPGRNNASIGQNSSLPTDQIILKYKPSAEAHLDAVQAEQMQRLSQAAGATLEYLREMSGAAHVLRLPERLPLEQVQAIAERLMALPEVEYAEPDQILYHTLVPNDPQYTNQWHYYESWGIDAPAAWDITTGSSSIVVAVIDTGITNHADLSGRTVPGYDFIADSLVANDGDGRDSNPSDPGDWITSAESSSGYFMGCPVSDSSWHGTHTAGTIGAASNNSLGVAGINWSSKILPVRVLGKCGGYTSDIVDGMRWAAGLSVSGVPANANPAKVLNISLGGPGACGSNYQNAINEITAAGAVVVTAAGNSSADASGFCPANCNGVITVAATNRSGNKAYYSNYGATVEISAPGGAQSYANDPNGILSTLNTGATVPVADTYAYYQGTSMAAPHVSGVVSLVLSRNPSLTPSQVLQILQDTAKPFPVGGTCTTSNCGSGIVDAGAAVSAVGKTWNGSVGSGWHDPDNWTPGGVPASMDNVTIPNVTNDPIISGGDAAVNSLTINPGAVLDLTDRTLTVEGALVNNGTLKQTQNAAEGGTTSFLRITNLAGTEVKYLGVDITPSDVSGAAGGPAKSPEAPRAPKISDPPAPPVKRPTSTVPGALLAHGIGAVAPLPASLTDRASRPGTSADLALLAVTNGDFESGLTGWTEYSTHGWDLILEAADLPVTPRSGSWAVWLGEDDDDISYIEQQVAVPSDNPNLTYWHWLASEDTCGYDFGGVVVNSTVVDTYNLCEAENTEGWVEHTVDLSAYAGQSVSLQIWAETDSSLNSNLLIDDVSLGEANTSPTIASLPDQTAPMNGSADNAIDLWAYASDAESADSELAFTIDNTPDSSAGISIDGNRYVDINPVADWTGQTDVAIRVTDPGDLSGTDTFQVTVSGTVTGTSITVSISGNQFCPDRTTGVKRCFDIAPAAPLSATVRFYFTESERNWRTLDTLLTYHYSGSDWIELPGPTTRGGTGDGQYVQVPNVASFSPFALDGEGGSAIYLPLVLRNYPPPPPDTFYSVGDACILQGYPTTNLGNTSDMWAGYDDYLNPDGRIARSLVQFDVSAIPAGTPIDNAILRVYLVNSWDYPGKTRTTTTYRIGSAWSESSVTWNKRPPIAEAYGSASVTHGAGTWYSFNVTNLVRGWVNGTLPNYGVMLRGPEQSGSDSSWKAFATREAGTAQAPYLKITYYGYDSLQPGKDSPAVEKTPAPGACGPTVTDVLGIPTDTPCCKFKFEAPGKPACPAD